jgi:hypothetical protein
LVRSEQRADAIWHSRLRALTAFGPTDLSSFGIDPRLGEADEKLALFHDSGHFDCFSLGKLIVAFFGMPGQKEADFRRSYAFVLATPTPT